MGVAAPFFLAGCSTTKVVELSSAEKQRQDYAVGVELARKFEAEYDLRQDSTISRYLEDLASELTRGSQTLRENPVRVMIVKDRDQVWRNFGFPGGRIYLSRTLLRSIQFENELAAAIALELAHIERRDVIRSYEVQSGSPISFGKGGVFHFSSDVRQRALEGAMEMMYQAGFDPRGMVRLFTRYQEHPERAPYEKAEIQVLMENSWRIIALHAPLRNPIIRSDRFLTVYQRMQQL